MSDRSLRAGFKAAKQAIRGDFKIGCDECDGSGCDDCGGEGSTPVGFGWSKPLWKR